MNLRWKYFLILVAASVIPLLTVTWISQNSSRRLGKTISGRAQNTLTDTVKQEMVRATRSFASFSLLGALASKLALKVLAAQAELALALPPRPPTKIYYATMIADQYFVIIIPKSEIITTLSKPAEAVRPDWPWLWGMSRGTAYPPPCSWRQRGLWSCCDHPCPVKQPLSLIADSQNN